MENKLNVLKFEKKNIPVPYESKEASDNKYVSYGYNNLYPNFLLSLYNDSPIHSSIINAKTTYIIGDGLKYADGADLDIPVNAQDGVKEFVDKIIKDFLIFNGFAVEVLFNVMNEPIEFHHVPFHKIRTNKTKTKFWFNEDWSYQRKNITYDRLTKQNGDNKSKIFYFDGYFPSLKNVYPQPEYNGSIQSILTDISIRTFNLNNIKNHFSVSSIITFFQGSNVDDSVRKKVLQDLTASYTGEEGKKLIVDFQGMNGKSAEVKSLAGNSWADEFEVLRKDVSDDIFIGHQITSPMLMGVKTEGQLGGATELETAYEIFKNTYIRVKRDELETALNQLFSVTKKVNKKLAFADKPLFNTQLSADLKREVLTINELRAEAGMKPLPNGDRLIKETAPAANPSASTAEQEQTTDQKKNSVAEVSKRKLTEEDYELIKDFGIHKDEFEIIEEYKADKFKFDKQEDVAQYVIDNDIKNLSIGQLKDLIQKDKGVQVSGSELRDILANLSEAGVIDVSYDDKGNVNVKPSNVADVPDTDKVKVLYQYVLRPGVDGPDLLDTSRSFCVKLIENNRLYTRADIQQMSSLFSYDVFRYAGGFYHNSETGETTPYCRHTWQALKVKRRSN